MCGELIEKIAEMLQSHADSHQTETPGLFKCNFLNCDHTATDLREHMRTHKTVLGICAEKDEQEALSSSLSTDGDNSTIAAFIIHDYFPPEVTQEFEEIVLD